MARTKFFQGEQIAGLAVKMHGDDRFDCWLLIASFQKSFDVRYSDYRSPFFHIGEYGSRTNSQNRGSSSVSSKGWDDDSITWFYACTAHREFQCIGTIPHTYAVLRGETPAQPPGEVCFERFHTIGKDGLARLDDSFYGGFDDRFVKVVVL